MATDRRTFQLTTGPVEILMSFALHQRVLNEYGTPEDLQAILQSPQVQTNIVAMILLGKDYPKDCTFSELLEKLEELGVSMSVAEEVIDWFFEHAVNFYEAQVQNLSKKLLSLKDQVNQAQVTAEGLMPT